MPGPGAGQRAAGQQQALRPRQERLRGAGARQGQRPLASKNAAEIAMLRQTGPLGCGIGGLILILAATIPFRRHWRAAFSRRPSSSSSRPSSPTCA